MFHGKSSRTFQSFTSLLRGCLSLSVLSFYHTTPPFHTLSTIPHQAEPEESVFYTSSPLAVRVLVTGGLLYHVWFSLFVYFFNWLHGRGETQKMFSVFLAPFFSLSLYLQMLWGLGGKPVRIILCTKLSVKTFFEPPQRGYFPRGLFLPSEVPLFFYSSGGARFLAIIMERTKKNTLPPMKRKLFVLI